MKRHISKLFLPLVVYAVPWGAEVAAQDLPPDSVSPALSVFEDCNARNCDSDHFRREMTWVNWVRDRRDADVHLLVTSQQTGGGGQRYTLDYIGRRAFEGITKSLSYVSDPNDTDSEVRDGLTRTMALGLVQFVETTSVATRLQVVYRAPDVAMVQRDERDPWNLWVFRLSANGSIEGESQQSGYSVRGSASANRVSEAFKINFGLSGRYSRDEFDLEDDTIINVSENYSANMLAVWSLSNHWSAGGTITANRSTFSNRDLTFTVGPAIEFNVFPYAESTRRSVTFRYGIEAAWFDYELETVEGQTEELLARHSLLLSAAVQQPWGEIFGSVEGIQYLHDPATHRVNMFLNVEYRLFRGFSLDVFGSFSRIKDQFFLPAEELTQEEVLLRRRQRETDFRFDVGIGFSYRFGSKFANIVNPRLGGGRRFFRF